MENAARLFLEANSQYESIKRNAETKAVRWEHYLAQCWHWNPDTEHSLKRALETRVASAKGAKWSNGFDEQNRLVVMKEINREKPIEVFVAYESYFATGSKFMNGQVQEQFKITFAHGRTVEVDTQLAELRCTFGYSWRDGKPAAKTANFHDGTISEDIVDENWNVLEEWKIKPNGKRVPANPELPKGTTLKSLAKQLSEQLPAIIKATLKTARISAPVYCLALAYDGETPGLSLACVGVGLESERKKVLAGQPDKAASMLWNPAEFTHYAKPSVELGGEELEQTCDWFNHLVEDKDSVEPVRKLLIEVATKLAKEDWEGVLKRTPDFVVYAVDYYLNDLEKNMKQTVPANLLKQFKKADWL